MSQLQTAFELIDQNNYQILQNFNVFDATNLTNAEIQNDIFKNMIDGVSEVYEALPIPILKYPTFQNPVPRWGRLIQSIGYKLIKPENRISRNSDIQPDGSWTDYLLTPQAVLSNYTGTILRLNFAQYIDFDAIDELANSRDNERIFDLYNGLVMNAFRSAIEVQNLIVPFLLGWLYNIYNTTPRLSNAIRQIPAIPTSTDLLDIGAWAIEVQQIVRQTKYAMRLQANSSFNLLGADVDVRDEELVLVAFIDPTGSVPNIAPLLESWLNSSNLGRGGTIAEFFGVGEFYAMPMIGDTELGTYAGSVFTPLTRTFTWASMPTMQTTDMSAGSPQYVQPNTQMALVQRGALNVGQKRMIPRFAMSERDATSGNLHLRTDIQVHGGGAGNVAFFNTPTTTP